MSFDRFRLFYRRTLAWRRFKRLHTHLNQIYWSHMAAKSHVFGCTKPHERTDPSSALFSYAQGNCRVPATLGEWAEAYGGFDQWSQMAAVMAITGYLESYIAQVATAAFESCPALIVGGGREINGAVLLKKKAGYDMFPYTESLTRGDWQARISAYKRFFRDCPFEARIGELEHLRKLRNDTGHSFGRDIEFIKSPESVFVQKLPNVDEGDIQKYLSLAEFVAESIERQIAAEYVGQYEIVKLFHGWWKRHPRPTEDSRVLAKQFSVYMNEISGNGYGKGPALKLIKWYQSL